MLSLIWLFLLMHTTDAAVMSAIAAAWVAVAAPASVAAGVAVAT